MSHNVILGPHPGQEPLLTEAPCDCPTETCHQMSERLGKICLEAVNTGALCPMGMATVLILMAATLVNPANAQGEDRESLKVLAPGVAGVMAKVGRGILARARQ